MLDSFSRAKFRVKIKSLAFEAKFIRREERRARTPADCNGLHKHRVCIVRSESRITLLAYAFARSMRYAVCERSEKPIDCKRVAAICTSLTGQKTEPEAIVGWYKESLVAKK
jgi:hypothetical protein